MRSPHRTLRSSFTRKSKLQHAVAPFGRFASRSSQDLFASLRESTDARFGLSKTRRGIWGGGIRVYRQFLLFVQEKKKYIYIYIYIYQSLE